MQPKYEIDAAFKVAKSSFVFAGALVFTDKMFLQGPYAY